MATYELHNNDNINIILNDHLRVNENNNMFYNEGQTHFVSNTDKQDNIMISTLKKIKKTMSNILDDIKNHNYNSFTSFLKIFVKDNRILYFGLFLLFICVILYIISLLFYSKKNIDLSKSKASGGSLDFKCNKSSMKINRDKLAIDKNDLQKLYDKIDELDAKIEIKRLAYKMLDNGPVVP